MRQLTHLLLILCLTHLGAATYYLDAANGLDTNPGTSSEPWQTLARAMINYSGSPKPAYGDTVLLKNGDYGSFNLPNSALTEYTGSLSDSLPTDQEYIVYKAAAGQTRVTMSSIVFNLGTKMYIVAHEFDGISITDATWHTVHIEGSMGVRIKNMTLKGITDPDTLYEHKTVYSMVVIDKPSSDITISGCEITGGYDGIDVLGWNCNIRILNNKIHHVGVDKIKSGGGVNMLIEGNEIYGNSYLTSEHPDCIQFYTAANRYGVSARFTNLTIRNNYIHDHSSQGLWTGGSYLENVVFENNLMHNLGNYEWRVYNVHGGIIRNNTIIANKIGNTGFVIYGGIYGDAGDENGELDSLPRNSDLTVVNNIFA